ncbi:MAG: hypothetical protein WBW33_03065 [Bryobacteraceae bacterium]
MNGTGKVSSSFAGISEVEFWIAMTADANAFVHLKVPVKKCR